MRIVPTAVLAALAAAALTACSSGGGGTSKTSAAPPPSDAHSVDPCTTLTVAEVQPLLTPTIRNTKQAEQPSGLHGAVHMCEFGTSSEAAALVVGVETDADAQANYASYTSSTDGPVAVPGVGDEAIRGDEDPDIEAMHGGTFCQASITDPGDIKGAAHLYDENGHHTDIGAAAFDTISAALGTLCNRIFGVGNTTPDLAPLATASAPAPSDEGGLPTDLQLPSDSPTS